MGEATKPLTLSQAREKARKYCAYQERCHRELRDKLYEWELHTNEVDQVIASMIEEGFLNEERFARAFAGGKFRIKHWGRVKIKNELKARQVSEYCIRAGLSEIDGEEYDRVLRKELEKKMKTLKDRLPPVRNQKAARYLMSKGFEPDLVWDCLRSYHKAAE